MTLVIADRVRETSTTTGTGNFTLAGAVTGYITFNTGITAGNTTYYCIVNQTVPSEWEVGFGTLSNSTTLVRTDPTASSNSNNAVNFSAGTKDVFITAPKESQPLVDPGICQGRLTLTSNTPVTTSDVTSTAIYFTPFNGNRVSLYQDGRWQLYSFAELDLTLSLTNQSTMTGNTSNGSTTVNALSSTTNLYVGQPVTGTGMVAGTLIRSINSASQISLTIAANATNTGVSLSFKHANYDVFIYNNSGTIDLDIVAWTDNDTRATALTTQDGVLVLTGSTNKKYIGTIRASSSTETTDSLLKRFVFNHYFKTNRALKVTESTDSWTYTTAAFRAANNNTANRVEVVIGQPTYINLQLTVTARNTNTSVVFCASICEDATNTNNADTFLGLETIANARTPCCATISRTPTVGYHFYQWVEYCSAVGSMSWSGDAATPTIVQSGMVGNIFC